jgi:ABC-type Na+ efflux pump permease subunit
MWTIARTDLKQLFESKDFWVPMALLGLIFFIIIPLIILMIIVNVGNVQAVQQVSQALDLLPGAAKQAVPKTTPTGTPVPPEAQVAYTIAVYLLSPVAVVVPLTISSAVGASTIVGERERGTGEFLAHSPADTREIYLGKLLASLVPGYLTVIVGFGAYSLLVNLVVAPKVGYWFFPTGPWWLLILVVIPPFIALALSLVLRLSARVRSTAAAQQATGLITLPLILIAYGQSTGGLIGQGAYTGTLGLGAIVWVVALISLATGLRSVKRQQLLGVADDQ